MQVAINLKLAQYVIDARVYSESELGAGWFASLLGHGDDDNLVMWLGAGEEPLATGFIDLNGLPEKEVGETLAWLAMRNVPFTVEPN
jgi:hypothetical protein